MNQQIPSILRKETSDHFSRKYPGSQHYNPSKIQNGQSIGNSKIAQGQINIDIPGVSRAYGPIEIYPKHAKSLAIPIHRAAYGKQPGEIQGLFSIKGKSALFIKENQGLVAMYALTKHVSQRQDSSIMPSDKTFSDKLGQRFFDQTEKQMTTHI